jgi:steroid 5-alpha reductase family enzyme
MESNLGRTYLNLKPHNVLDTGLWGLCRHPNYFGEALWWGALSVGYGYLIPSTGGANKSWIIFGWIINFLVMLVSIQLIEQKMRSSSNVAKARAYRYYQDYTSMFFPWWNSKCTYMCGVAVDSKLNSRK